MKKTEEVEDHTTKRIRWIARVWGTLIIVFTLFMFIGYAWNWVTTGKADPLAVENYSALENLPPLFVLLSVLGLGIAWRWEELGGAITIVFSLANLLMLLIHWPITHHFPQFFGSLWYMDDNHYIWNAIPDLLVAIEKETSIKNL